MKTLKELKNFIILWLTQSFSALGSSMTSFALVIWLFRQRKRLGGGDVVFLYGCIGRYCLPDLPQDKGAEKA